MFAMINTQYIFKNYKELYRKIKRVLKLNNISTMSKTPCVRPIKQGSAARISVTILKSAAMMFLTSYPHQT